MKPVLDTSPNPSAPASFPSADLLRILEEKDRSLEEKDRLLVQQQALLKEREALIAEQQKLLRLMEEQLRLARLRKFGARSEKLPFQGELFDAARLACERTGEAARCFRDFRYRTRKSWSYERRVIGKAEYLPGKANPRFVVTNLSTRDADAQHLYEDLYCARGEMEKFIGNEFSRKPRRGEAQGCAEQNRIKEQQLGLFADRTSSATLRANQLRLYFSSFAYVLLHGLRRLGLTGTAFAKAQSTTIRLKLLKIGARLRLTARKVWLSFSEAYPYASDIAQILANLKQHPAWSPPG